MSQRNYRQALIEKIEVPVRQAEVCVDSVNTSYLCAGSGYPVICLHGGGAGAVTWYPVIGSLAKCYQVIAPDIVGFGESDKPAAKYDRAYFVSWLKRFMHELEISRAHLVGLSQGGAVALQFTIDDPEMVDKLVLVNSGGLGAKTPLLPLLGMIWMNTFPSVIANRFFSRYLLANPENRDPNHSSYSIDVLKRKGGKNVFRQGRGAAVSAISESLLSSIETETLVIWGEEDRFFPVQCAVNAVAVLANATLCKIEGAGHLSIMDKPEIFNNTLMKFLNRSEDPSQDQKIKC
ncbi:MAG: alpha/beta fold hydrolase [Akkermansiaceae bacterium]